MYLEYSEQPLGSREQNFKNMTKLQEVISKLLSLRQGQKCFASKRVSGSGIGGEGKKGEERKRMWEQGMKPGESGTRKMALFCAWCYLCMMSKSLIVV